MTTPILPPQPVLPPRSLALVILRALAGKTQEEAALAAGLSPDTISEYERGKREPPIETLRHIGESMGYTEPMVAQVALSAGEICDCVRLGADPKHEVAAGVGRQVAAISLVVLTRLEEEQDRRQAREVWDRIRDFTPEERLQFLEAFPELHTWAVVEAFSAESERAAAHSAVTAREIADLAVWIADRVEESIRPQVQLYAWAFWANSRRVAGKLNESEEAFTRSASFSEATGSAICPLDASRPLDLEASLRREQRRPLKALELLARAASTPGLPPLARARLLIKKANTLVVLGECEKALAALRDAAPAVESGQDLRLFWLLRFGWAVCLCHLNRAAEAEALLSGVHGLRLLATQSNNHLQQIRLRWLESKIAAGLGRTVEAIETLSSVRADFVHLGIAYDAALATTELAALYLEVGRTAEVKTLTLQSVPIFTAEGVLPEAQKALALFCDAVERETVTLAMARRLVNFLERVQHDATVSFEA